MTSECTLNRVTFGHRDELKWKVMNQEYWASDNWILCLCLNIVKSKVIMLIFINFVKFSLTDIWIMIVALKSVWFCL